MWSYTRLVSGHTFSFWSTLTLLLVHLVMGRASGLGVFVLGFGFLRGLSFSAEVLQRVILNVVVCCTTSILEPENSNVVLSLNGNWSLYGLIWLEVKTGNSVPHVSQERAISCLCYLCSYWLWCKSSIKEPVRCFVMFWTMKNVSNTANVQVYGLYCIMKCMLWVHWDHRVGCMS